MDEQYQAEQERENLSGMENTAYMSWIGSVEKDSKKLIKDQQNDKRRNLSSSQAPF
jgi:hypothetical protein